MSDAWDEIQAIKSKRNSLRERLEKRKKERQDILGTSSGNSTVLSSSPVNISNIVPQLKSDDTKSELNEIFTTVDNGKYSTFYTVTSKCMKKDRFYYYFSNVNRIRSRD